MFDRREVLIRLAAALGGSTALASCGNASEAQIAASIAPTGDLKFYTPAEYDLVSKLADAIIPRTDTPGALDVGVADYLDSMMHVWASDETRAEHRQTLTAIDKALGDRFARMSGEDRTSAVRKLDADAFAAREGNRLASGYRGLKELIAQIYYSSEPGATEELHYEPVPGRWDGDVALSEIGKTWYN